MTGQHEGISPPAAHSYPQPFELITPPWLVPTKSLTLEGVQFPWMERTPYSILIFCDQSPVGLQEVQFPWMERIPYSMLIFCDQSPIGLQLTDSFPDLA